MVRIKELLNFYDDIDGILFVGSRLAEDKDDDLREIGKRLTINANKLKLKLQNLIKRC